MTRRLSFLLVTLAACGGGSPPPQPAAYEFLTPREHLVRASMMIRGLRPTPEDLARVDADPNAIREIVATYLQSPEFADTIRDMHGELYQTRDDIDEQLPSLGTMTDTNTEAIFTATSEEPLELVEHVVTNDRPYTEIVTADYVMANPVLSRIYQMEYDPTGPEWQESHYLDGREHAGILSSSEIYRRHVSNGSNFERGRANFWASTLLCEAFSDRDVTVEGGVDLSNNDAVTEAVSTNPTCIGCHQALDPMAAAMWGFPRFLTGRIVDSAETYGCFAPIDDAIDDPEQYWRFTQDLCYPLRFYAPENENLWKDYGLRPPSYYGTPISGLADLGAHIAADPRFAQCSARQFYRWFGQIELSDVGPEQSARLQAQFVADGYNVRSYVEDLVLSDTFRAVRRTDDQADPALPVQVVRPEQYARVIKQLTGFTWTVDPDGPACAPVCWGEVDLGDSDLYGFRAMSGGIDGLRVTLPIHTVTPTRLLVLQRYADEAAAWAVKHDFALPAAQRTLLGSVEPTTADDTTLRAQIASLTETILSQKVGPTDAGVTELLVLYHQSLAERDSTAAWTVVVSMLLQDPQILYY